MNITIRSRDPAWLRGGTTDVTNAHMSHFFRCKFWPSSRSSFDLGPSLDSLKKSICPTSDDNSTYEKIGDHCIRTHLFGNLRLKTIILLQHFVCVCQLQVQEYTTTNRCSEKNCTKNFLLKAWRKNQQNVSNTLLSELRKKKKRRSPCSYLLYKQNSLLPSVTRMLNTPNMVIPKYGAELDYCILCIGHGALCWTLNSGPMRSRVASSLGSGSLPSVVTTESRYWTSNQKKKRTTFAHYNLTLLKVFASLTTKNKSKVRGTEKIAKNRLKE